MKELQIIINNRMATFLLLIQALFVMHYIKTDIYTDRQVNILTDYQTWRHTDRHTGRHTYKQVKAKKDSERNSILYSTLCVCVCVLKNKFYLGCCIVW